MSRASRTCFFVLMAWQACSGEAAEVDVYIAAGQSNMDGRGLVSDLGLNDSLRQPQADARIWYANPARPDSDETDYLTGWQALQPGYSVAPGFDPNPLPSNTFGPELSFAGAIRDATGTENDVAIVKVSKGGTSIRESRGEWHGNPNDNPGYLFNALISNVNDALDGLAAVGDTGVIKGVIWHQGEADRDFNFYIPNLLELIEGVRGEFGADLPFVIGELSQDRSDNETFNQNVANFVDDPGSTNLGLVSSVGLTTVIEDDTHFNAASQVVLGQRFAQTLAPLVVAIPEPGSTGVVCLGTFWILRRRRIS